MEVVNAIASLIAAALALPALVYALENFAALLGRARAARMAVRCVPRPRFAVLVPAHDEAAIIGDTVDGLKSQLQLGDRVLVVADNCTDQTAAIARDHGVEVTERSDPDHRGKGFAIVHGLDLLASDPPDVLIIVDADCQVSGAGLNALATAAAALQRPVQADYLMHSPEGGGRLTRISAFALVVRNRVRPLGLWAMGLPTQLMGSGMAFPWTQIREAPHLRDNLVEDLVMGLALAEQGHAPWFFPAVKVCSVLPDRARVATSQRKRWEHGQLSTLVRHGPALVLRGVATWRRDLVALGLDLLTPPLALLLMLLIGAAMLGVIGTWFGLSAVPALIVLGGLAMVGTATLCSWWSFGRDTVPLATLATVPLYLLWKIPLYLALVLRRRQRTWVRTGRPSEGTSLVASGKPRTTESGIDRGSGDENESKETGSEI